MATDSAAISFRVVLDLELLNCCFSKGISLAFVEVPALGLIFACPDSINFRSDIFELSEKTIPIWISGVGLLDG